MYQKDVDLVVPNFAALGTVAEQIRKQLGKSQPKVAILPRRRCGWRASSPLRRRTCRG